MSRKLVPRRAVLLLVASAIVLPIAICMILAVGAILGAMGDTQGGVALQRIALAGGILWAIDLICLVVVLALNTLIDNQDPPEADVE